jgi:hypothetical protein
MKLLVILMLSTVIGCSTTQMPKGYKIYNLPTELTTDGIAEAMFISVGLNHSEFHAVSHTDSFEYFKHVKEKCAYMGSKDYKATPSKIYFVLRDSEKHSYPEGPILGDARATDIVRSTMEYGNEWILVLFQNEEFAWVKRVNLKQLPDGKVVLKEGSEATENFPAKLIEWSQTTDSKLFEFSNLSESDKKADTSALKKRLCPNDFSQDEIKGYEESSQYYSYVLGLSVEGENKRTALARLCGHK